MLSATTTVSPDFSRSIGPSSPPAGPARLTSIDAFRGFVMLLMMGEVLRFGRVASALPSSSFWQFLAHHQSHVPWVGCSLHDLIQPSFSFLVGVALPFSIASRTARGQSRRQMTWHTVRRAFALIFLGIFLRSIGRPQTNWTFEDTLTQIGLGYGFLFFLAFRSPRDQWIAFALILVGFWAAFALYPVQGAAFDYPKVGVPKDWPHLMAGFKAHWNKNSNFSWAFDCWFLNLFPREKPFVYNAGGWTTLAFIPTLAVMLLGLLAGQVICSERPPWTKVKWLAVAGLMGLASGAALGWLGVCPVIKRVWTSSYSLYAGGWCLLLLAGFYVLTNVLGWKRWAFPLVVVGMNSIAAYCMAHLFEDFVSQSLVTHLGRQAFGILGPPYRPLLHGAATLLVLWLLLLWMYRRKIFLRI